MHFTVSEKGMRVKSLNRSKQFPTLQWHILSSTQTYFLLL